MIGALMEEGRITAFTIYIPARCCWRRTAGLCDGIVSAANDFAHRQRVPAASRAAQAKWTPVTEFSA